MCSVYVMLLVPAAQQVANSDQTAKVVGSNPHELT